MLQRRDFLKAGIALPLLGNHAPAAKSCILLMLTGGPSHLDTWDMKPDAASHIRGPFHPIKTNVPGIEISEIFPRMARHAEKYALIRSVHHEAAAVHETGLQLMQTGRTFLGDDQEWPHIGCVTAKAFHSTSAILPFAIGHTGANFSHGQTAGDLGSAYEPHLIRGPRDFEQNCQTARRLVESGVRFVTVNMFETVFNQPGWDAHGSKPFSTLNDYRDHAGPAFDRGFTTLLEELSQRGLLDTTLVVAMGEFGRSPRINPAGGRDHWPQCWTILMAGGGIKGGQIYGSSDSIGAEPRDNPVSPAMVVATICKSLGLPTESTPITALFTTP